MISLEDIAAARQVIEGKLHRTPVAGSTYLSDQVGANLAFKLEMFQKTGSSPPPSFPQTAFPEACPQRHP